MQWPWRLPLTAAITVRCLLVSIATLTAAWDPLADLVRQINAGEHLAYCYAAVPLAICIAYANRLRDIPASHKIGDRQSDWLVALPVAVVSLAGARILIQSLGGYAELWRVDLFASVCWCWACLVLAFGLRPVMRHWRAWAFLLSCWPALHVLIAISLGNSLRAYAVANAILAAWCTFLAIVDTRRRWLLALLSAGLCLVAEAIVGTHHPVLAALAGMTMPAVVIGGYIVLVINRRGHRMRASQPGHLAGIVAVVVICLGSVATRYAMGPLLVITHGPIGQATAVISSEDVAHVTGWNLVPGQTTALSSVIFGPSTAATRSYLTLDHSTYGCWVDIVTATQGAVLDLMGSTVTYGLGGNVRRAVGVLNLGHHIRGSVLYADPAEQTEASAEPWVMVVWRVRLPNGHQQRIAVIGYGDESSDGELLHPSKLPAMKPLTMAVLPQTLGFLVRGEAQQPGNLPYIPPAMLSLAKQIVALEQK